MCQFFVCFLKFLLLLGSVYQISLKSGIFELQVHLPCQDSYHQLDEYHFYKQYNLEAYDGRIFEEVHLSQRGTILLL